MRHAKDEKCIDCGKQAVVFWPMVDPDIPANPYCRPCVNRAQISLLEKLNNIDPNENNN